MGKQNEMSEKEYYKGSIKVIKNSNEIKVLDAYL